MDPSIDKQAEELLKRVLEVDDDMLSMKLPGRPGVPSPVKPRVPGEPEQDKPLAPDEVSVELFKIVGQLQRMDHDGKLEPIVGQLSRIRRGIMAHGLKDVLKSPYSGPEQTPFGAGDVVDATHESYSDGGLRELPDPNSEVQPEEDRHPEKKRKLIPRDARRMRLHPRRK
jgi:hypothetical protein